MADGRQGGIRRSGSSERLDDFMSCRARNRCRTRPHAVDGRVEGLCMKRGSDWSTPSSVERSGRSPVESPGCAGQPTDSGLHETRRVIHAPRH